MIAFSLDNKRHRAVDDSNTIVTMAVLPRTSHTLVTARKAQWMAGFLANMHVSDIYWSYHGPAYDWDQNVKPEGVAKPSAQFPLPPEVEDKYYLASDLSEQIYYDHAYIVYFDKTVYSGVMVYANNDHDAIDEAADLLYDTTDLHGFFIPQDDLNDISDDDISFVGGYGQAVSAEYLRIVQLY